MNRFAIVFMLCLTLVAHAEEPSKRHPINAASILQAVQFASASISDTLRAEILALNNPDEMKCFDHSLGLWVRNNCGLLEEDSKLISVLEESRHSFDGSPDSASHIILCALWAYEQGKASGAKPIAEQESVAAAATTAISDPETNHIQAAADMLQMLEGGEYQAYVETFFEQEGLISMDSTVDAMAKRIEKQKMFFLDICRGMNDPANVTVLSATNTVAAFYFKQPIYGYICATLKQKGDRWVVGTMYKPGQVVTTFDE